MGDGHSRHVSAGALILAVCALLTALVGAFSVLASDLSRRVPASNMLEVPGRSSPFIWEQEIAPPRDERPVHVTRHL